MMKQKTRIFSGVIGILGAAAVAAHGQVLLSSGTNYVQDFDTLANASGGRTNAPWTNNATLQGWYARSEGKDDYTSYRISHGERRENGLYGFGSDGTNAASDRALGAMASSSPKAIAYGVRFKNDTTNAMTSVVVSYTGEQWRNSTANASDQTLGFWYRTGAAPITKPDAGVTDGWIAVKALDFTRLHYGGEAGPLDGNASANRKKLSAPLTGLNLKPGEELFLRWLDVDDEGQNDHGLAIDELTVSFTPDGSAR